MHTSQVSFYSWEFFLLHLYFPVVHDKVRASISRKTYTLTAAPKVLNLLFLHAVDSDFHYCICRLLKNT